MYQRYGFHSKILYFCVEFRFVIVSGLRWYVFPTRREFLSRAHFVLATPVSGNNGK